MDGNTTLPTEQSQDVLDQVARVLDQIRPAIQADGGDVELVDITEQDVARIRFHGACITCPSRLITLKSGIEHSVRQQVPQITAVQQIN